MKLAFLLLAIAFFLSILPNHNALAVSTVGFEVAQDSVVKSDSIQIETLIREARNIHRNEHNEEREFELLEEAATKALVISDTLLYSKALDAQGLLYRYHQNYPQALAFHAKALELVKHKVEELPLPNMIYANNAGVASRYNQDYDKAIEFYLHSLKIAEKTNNLRNIAIACNGLGNTYIYLPEQEDKALVYFKRSLKTEQERNNSLGVAMNYLSISDYYNQKKDYLKSREYLDRLLAINQERDDDFGLAITYEFYGLNYLKENKDIRKALEYYQLALQKFKKLNDTHKIADVYSQLGTVYQKLGNSELAISFYSNSVELAKSIENYGLLAANNLDLAEIFENRGQYKEALNHFKKGKTFEDSVALIEQQTKIDNLEKQYQLEQKEDQIELLEKDQKLQASVLENQEERLKNQRNLVLLLALGLIAISIILILLFRNLRLKKKNNRQLSSKNEQIESINQELQKALKDVVIEQERSEQQKLKLLESKFENKIQELTLKSLESQMNPHFLFNGMNAVRWLVVQRKNEAAEQYMESFAELLRLSLTNNRKDLISLEEEIKTIELYLKIEKLRFDEEFQYTFTIKTPISLESIKIPPKILQPLVENAIKHGLLPSRREDKTLQIEVKENNSEILISIIDNGIGFNKNYKGSAPKEGSTHLGLDLIQERIDVHNNRLRQNLSFSIRKMKEGDKIVGTIAQLRLSVDPKNEAVLQEVR